MTPIAELQVRLRNQGRGRCLRRCGDHYRTNHGARAFDPIALRLGVADARLAADLTIMPLIVGSDYRHWLEIARGAAIAPDAGDRHEAIAQIILAINSDSNTLRSGAGLLATMAPGARLDPLSWLGQSVSLYLDDDPFWQELAALPTSKEREDFLEHNVGRIPVALWAEVANGFKLTAFLTGARAFIEQTAPGMTTWESLEHQGQPYVKISPTGRGLPPGPDGRPMSIQLYYAASGKFLLLTPSEAVMKRALDRQAALATDKKDGAAGVAKDDAGPRPPWLGSSLAMQVDYKLWPLVTRLAADQHQQWMQSRSWNNLPILNEWHRLYPDQDPLAVHDASGTSG